MPKGLRIFIAAVSFALPFLIVALWGGDTDTEHGGTVATTAYAVDILPPEPTPSYIPKITPEPEDYWNSDAHWLAMALERESGIDWPDWAVMAIGEVVLNRVESGRYPDTVEEVLRDPGQYAPFLGYFTPFWPEERYRELAERLLDGERVLNDEAVIYQALFEQGAVTVVSYYDEVLGSTTYFCK